MIYFRYFIRGINTGLLILICLSVFRIADKIDSYPLPNYKTIEITDINALPAFLTIDSANSLDWSVLSVTYKDPNGNIYFFGAGK